jgi:putative phosphoesterase
LISDTHGLLRPEALHALGRSDRIIHAGDIGDAAILAALREIAPVTAVRGNNDVGSWARAIRETETLKISNVSIHVLHDVSQLGVDPAAAGFQAVISGHSHKPRSHMKEGVLFVNPGSAGPRRFTLPISLGFLVISEGAVQAELVELKTPGCAKSRGRVSARSRA